MKTPQVPNVILRLALPALALLGAPTARAQTQPPPRILVVNTAADLIDDNPGNGVCHASDGSCSLRAAIMEANHLTAPGVTQINVPAGTFTLTRPSDSIFGSREDTGDLDLDSPLGPGQRIDIMGAGAGQTIIDGNQIDRVISVHQGRTATLSRITIRNGKNSQFDGAGGGVQNEGTLTIVNSTIEFNYSPSAGGGIYNQESGVLRVLDSTIRSNATAYSGGGMYLMGSATVQSSTISSNGANYGGGAYVLGNGAFFIRGSTLNGNGATHGGGIFTDNDLLNTGIFTLLTVVDSTISGNFAYTNGGGINNRSTVWLYNTSVVDNDADHDHDETSGTGGGVYNGSGWSLVVFNTLVANNTLGNVPVYNDCYGTLEAHSWNLFSDLSGCTFAANGNFARGLISPNTIGTLQNNGGPTMTHALLAGSEAINSTNNQGCVDETGAPLTTDQRGAPRGAGLNCDVGAFEFGALVDLVFKNGFD